MWVSELGLDHRHYVGMYMLPPAAVAVVVAAAAVPKDLPV